MNSPDMIWIPGGTFRTGSDRHYPEEGPGHVVTVGAFLMDRHPLTNREFKQFVKATRHVTAAEISAGPKTLSGYASKHNLCWLAGVHPSDRLG
jgi:formylglycine-generating enzyme